MSRVQRPKLINAVRPIVSPEQQELKRIVNLAIAGVDEESRRLLVIPEIFGFTPLNKTDYKKTLFGKFESSFDEHRADVESSHIKEIEKYVLDVNGSLPSGTVSVGAISLRGAQDDQKGVRSVALVLGGEGAESLVEESSELFGRVSDCRKPNFEPRVVVVESKNQTSINLACTAINNSGLLNTNLAFGAYESIPHKKLG